MIKEYWVIDDKKIHNETRKIINDFFTTLKVANRAKLTITTYRGVLKRFFLDCPKQLSELTPDDVLNWLRKNHRYKKETTINLFINVLNIFFKYCQTEGYIDKVMIKRYWKPKLPKTTPKYLDNSELAKVKLCAEKNNIRDRAIVELLVSSGCRCAEVHYLNIEDLDLTNRTARVIGKGKSLREVHFTETCAILLKKYLKYHPQNISALFLNKFGKRLGQRSIYNITSVLGKKAGLRRNLGPHCLRHTFATRLLAKGAELDFIAEELGHKDINTTRVYARLPSEQIVNLYRRYMG
ncbi:MAG: hypothetical protein JL50_06235 [Peptococcaceae bacterium BICA1-7]|nr:MAG: hypothetical protein JL50_06235 [Peptococcaceae bacterium BICA1-7]HBV96175.1 integrase [Desulfotomaculum sp.]